MAVHILGIRHHGVGSAVNVQEYLEAIKPDIVLVEGPPEIEDMLAIIGNKELLPPAAIMIYDEKDLNQSSFYPFAAFSPEWVAAKYANQNGIPLRALDLPANITFALAKKAEATRIKEIEKLQEEQGEDFVLPEPKSYPADPISYLAQAAGYSGEEWWDLQFETVREDLNSEQHFAAVMAAMTALRKEEIPSALDKENISREAYMRFIIRAVQNEMYTNIAIICGAWHAPALEDIDGQEKEDAKILKKLPKPRNKVTASWIPWTNGRLASQSGYGAGIDRPGWYEHQWGSRKDTAMSWLINVAEVFRKEQVDISTAHVIETYRLSHSLAKLRNHSVVTYNDMNDAVKTVMCMGDEILFELIREKLNINDKIGSIPSDLPQVPLQQDFAKTVKKLRLKQSAMPKQMDLDLRKPTDLARSVFFHRLEILGIKWAEKAYSRSKGTFKESWTLNWKPEMEIQIIDKAHFGNTIELAAENTIKEIIDKERKINVLVQYIENTIPAELFQSMDLLLDKVNNETSISSDTKDLMRSLPKLIHISRYGDVRNTDVERITDICNRLFQKIEISIVNACYGLDEDNSNEMFELISQLNKSFKLIQTEETLAVWMEKLREITEKEGVHMVIKGCTIRLLFDQKELTEEEVSTLLQYYLSPNQDAMDVASWVEGFLRGSGLILIYDNKIWNMIYEWVDTIESEQFMELIPVLRRAFSKFPFGERRQIGAKAKKGLVLMDENIETESSSTFDKEAAVAIIPIISKYLA